MGYDMVLHHSSCTNFLNLYNPYFNAICRIIETNKTSIMVSFRSSLLACLLASTSYAFAVKPATQSLAFAQRSGPTRTVNLNMSGGSTSVPDLKVGIWFN